MSPVHGVTPGNGETETLVLSSTNVEPLFGVEGNTLCYLLKVVAELAQHVAWGGVPVKHQA